MDFKQNTYETASSLVYEEDKQKMTKTQSVLAHLNISTAIFIIILTNTFTVSKYFLQATTFEIENERIYLSITLGLLYTAVFSGKLNLIKNISLSQLFMLSFMIKAYGVHNIGVISLSLAFYLFLFMQLNLHNAHKLIPRSALVGAKITMNILLVFQQLFNLNLASNPPFILTLESYILYFSENFNTFPKFTMMVLALNMMVIVYFQKKFKSIPIIFILFIIGIFFGFAYKMIVGEIDNISFMNLPKVYAIIPGFFTDNFSNLKNLSLIGNSNFILHSLLYSLLVFIEFLCSISLLKAKQKKPTQCEREILCMIAANLLHAFLGLLPVSAGFDINMQI